MSTSSNRQGAEPSTSPQREPPRCSSSSQLLRHQKLIEWVVQNGGLLHPSLSIAHNSIKGYHVVVNADSQVDAETRVAISPASVTLSVLNALNIEPFSNRGTVFPPEFLERYQDSSDVIQSFFLMEQYLLGKRSWWSPYIESLPSLEMVTASQYETEDDIDWIRGTNLEYAFVFQKRKWEQQFEEANALLKELDWTNAKNDRYNQDLYRWASAIFGSRSFTSKVLHGTRAADLASDLGRDHPEHDMLESLFAGRFAVLLPLMDIFSHRPTARVEWQANVDGVALQILDGCTAGQEVYNNYGVRDNEGLLMSYGFVLEDNRCEHALISIIAHPGSLLETTRSWPKNEAASNDFYNCYVFGSRHSVLEDVEHLERALFSYDLLDSISVMCANDREQQAMHQVQRTLMHSFLPNDFEDYHNYHATLAQIMRDCITRATRLVDKDPARRHPRREPQNQKQRYAQIYRDKQIEILRSAAGVCAFVLLRACTEQSTSDLLLNIQLKIPECYSQDMADICTRMSCATRRGELFTAAALVDLLPSPTANGVRSLMERLEVIIETTGSSPLTHEDEVKIWMTVTLSALCIAHLTATQMSSRLTTWIQELTSSYPPDDPNWSFVVPLGPYPVDEEPPAGLVSLLGAQSQAVESVGSDSTARRWLEPEMICWAWNVMEEEVVRVPIEVEKFVSDGIEDREGQVGYLMYCRHD